jgi:outer membrane protein OmpA-like peptidoglycan-associated protein/tetratricopeptide (TPR) repeat protein
MRALLIIFLFGLLNNICYSQTKASISDVRNIFDEKGDYYFDKKEFKKSIVYYNMAYKQDANNYYSILRKAEAYTALELYEQAAECYRIIFKTNLYISNEYRLQYALLLLKNKDIKGFEKWMGNYDEIVYSEIHNYVSSNEVRAKMYKDSVVVVIENESILNTSESEICPSPNKDKIVFASSRKNLSGSAGTSDFNIFSASYLENGQLGKLNIFNKSLNSSQNESSIAFSYNTNSLYFTRGTTANLNLKTYLSIIPANPKDALDIKQFQIEGFSSVGHVSFNSKGNKIYFVSEAPGGSGGLDIYFSDFVGGKWIKPTNIGANINSNKDEMYPYLLNDSLLYFSSAGHNGLGGLDLYSVNLNQQNSTPLNLGNKVNSEYDDYALSFSEGGYTGYFCSNRPGGFGKEDIYRVHILDLKVKLAAFKFKKKTTIEKDKINLYLSNGEEYNITSEDKAGFDFTFLPEEPYIMVIQHENVAANDIIGNYKLSTDQKEKEFLNPKPIEKTEIKLQEGMKYQFTAGMKPLSNEYKSELNELSKDYQNSNDGGTIDLTALAKELLLTEGEIYTIQFVKDNNLVADNKNKGESGLIVNQQIVSVSGRSFFIVLPLDIQSNFNIKTDIAYIKETYKPNKVSKVVVDETPILKQEQVKQSEGFPILVNAESFTEVESGKKILATELSIVPGSMYMLSFNKIGGKKEEEVIVPLTKGVKYNLGSEVMSEKDYNNTLSQMVAGQNANNPNEELIDISVLSKELDVFTEKNIVFSLTPVRQFSTQTADTRSVLTTLSVDGRKYFVTTKQKLLVNLNLDQNRKVNIQTDLGYIKENFIPSTISINVDTTSFHTSDIGKDKNIITDPVFDVIVVNFDLREFVIRPDAKSIIENKVIQALKGDSRLYVTIKGYTDALGDAAYNEKLSKNRAQAVKDYLTSNGIGENRIRTFSFGASLALKEGENWKDMDEAELQKHRKVEIVIYLPK